MFQFLIGTVKTRKAEASSFMKGRFQFLIGTVKTRKKKLPYTLEGRVSIPHRYCKNLVTN